MNQYCVYIMTNTRNTVLYTGVTNNIFKRVTEHRNKTGSKFTSKYNITKLVYYESFARVRDALAAEKKIKAGSRAKKIRLIENNNPQWEDLYDNSLVLSKCHCEERSDVEIRQGRCEGLRPEAIPIRSLQFPSETSRRFADCFASLAMTSINRVKYNITL